MAAELTVAAKPRNRLRKITILTSLLLMAGGIYGVILLFSPMPVKPVSVIEPADITALVSHSSVPVKLNNRLIIPKLGIDMPYEAGDDSVLENAVWWRHPDRGNPADGGNFILSAHRFYIGLTPAQTRQRSPFYNIHKLAEDDLIQVIYDNEIYNYKVTRTYRVAPNDVSIEAPSEEAKLTLYSCTFGGTHDGREIVDAKLAS